MDYIILQKTESGYKPLSFSNGDTIIYGTKQEAIYDLKENEILAEIKYLTND